MMGLWFPGNIYRGIYHPKSFAFHPKSIANPLYQSNCNLSAACREG